MPRGVWRLGRGIVAILVLQLGAPSARAAQAVPRQGRMDQAEVNVRDFGALGDGRADDTQAIEAAMASARQGGLQVRMTGDPYRDADRRGGTVFFPSGRYMVSRPLIMPRSGNYAANAVSLVGASPVTTTIAASATFPPGRALIEWERVPGKRVQRQRFVGLGLDIQAVPGGMAIHFAPTTKTTYAEVHAEGLYQMLFRDLIVYADNSKNPGAIRIEGRIDNSLFEDLVLDATLGTSPKYSTVLLHFDDDLLGAGEHARLYDYPGFNMGRIARIGQSIRGGRGTALKGRLAFVKVSDVTHGNGALGSEPAVHLRNCGEVTLENLVFEGRSEDGELRIENCSGVHAHALAIGRTEEGPGVGIKVVNSRWVRIEGRASGIHSAPYSLNGSRLLSVDAATRDSRFEWFTGSAPFEKEVEWLPPDGVGNFIDYLDLRTGRRTVLGDASNKPALGPQSGTDCPTGYSEARSRAGDRMVCARGEDELLRVGDVWVDRWEASLTDDGNCTRGAGDRKAFACSRYGTVPATGLSAQEAAMACARSGKHLITAAEWDVAVTGTPSWSRAAGVEGCSEPVAKVGAPAAERRCNTCSGALSRAGASTRCSSEWGVADLVGNAAEWVAVGPGAEVRGGDHRGTAGHASGPAVVGFRCARSR